MSCYCLCPWSCLLALLLFLTLFCPVDCFAAVCQLFSSTTPLYVFFNKHRAVTVDEATAVVLSHGGNNETQKRTKIDQYPSTICSPTALRRHRRCFHTHTHTPVCFSLLYRADDAVCSCLWLPAWTGWTLSSLPLTCKEGECVKNARIDRKPILSSFAK